MKKDTSLAKFVFLYLLSLIALVFVTVASGNVLFQIINKYFVDLADSYATGYSLSALRFAISSLVVAAPVYFVSMRQINKNLAEGNFDINAALRKWLTYFILLVASVVMIGDLIFVINSFLQGELTVKFALKTAVVLAIAGAVFGYYLYDIRRERVDAKDPVVTGFRYGAIAAVIVVFIAGLFFVESPAVAREKRLDNQVVQQLVQLESGIQSYYTDEEALPERLDQLPAEVPFITERSLNNPVTGEVVEYRKLNETEYELCTTFTRSNENPEDRGDRSYGYWDQSWQHGAGRDCFERQVQDFGKPLR